MKYAYSYDEERYYSEHDTPVDAAIAGFKEASTAKTVWVGEVDQPAAHRFIDADCILNTVYDSADDECGEFSEGWLTDVSEAHKKELEKLIGDWLEEKYPPDFFMILNAVSYTREQLIAEGLLEATEGGAA